jgi:hypothetical protein
VSVIASNGGRDRLCQKRSLGKHVATFGAIMRLSKVIAALIAKLRDGKPWLMDIR